MMAALATCGFIIWLYLKLSREENAAGVDGPPEPGAISTRLAELERRVRAVTQSLGDRKP